MLNIFLSFLNSHSICAFLFLCDFHVFIKSSYMKNVRSTLTCETAVSCPIALSKIWLQHSLIRCLMKSFFHHISVNYATVDYWNACSHETQQLWKIKCGEPWVGYTHLIMFACAFCSDFMLEISTMYVTN